MQNGLNFTEPLTLGYVRVSTDRQDLSVDAQTQTVQRAANYQIGNGADVPVEIFAEPDVSGSLPFAERPQGRALIQRVQLHHLAGGAVNIIIPKVDRLGRDTIDVSQTVKLLESYGARMMFLDINVDTRTPMGRAFMQIAAVFAELELSRIKERIQTALDHKRGQGLVTGTVPYGWNAVDTGQLNAKGKPIRRLEPNPDEQRWLLHMAALKAQGYSYNAIAIDLNTKRVPTKNTGKMVRLKGGIERLSKGEWQFGHIATILNSRTVLDWLASRDHAQAAA